MAAAAARSIDRVVVSTDDFDVIDLAKRAKVEAPFIRPAALASDSALAVDVILHALDWLETRERYRPDAVLWLQPTSPLRIAADIDAAADLFRRRSANSVVSVCVAGHHPAWMRRIDGMGRLRPWDWRLKFPQRRQDLAPVFAFNGAIYLTRSAVLRRRRTFHPPATYAYVMPRERSLDVDTEWDLCLADFILRERGGRADG